MSFATRKMVGIVVLAALIGAASNGSSVRRVGVREGAFTRAGEVCAEKVIETTEDCFQRPAESGGVMFRCNGHNLDQDCQAATTNTGNICNKGKANCSGKQEIQDPFTLLWSFDSNDCDVPKYVTAALRSGDCTPAKK